MMVKKKEFTGRLAEPIKVDGSGSKAAEALEKFLLLLDHYSIESRENDSHWCELAMSLAMDFVPGLQLEHADLSPGRGRKKDDPAVLFRLIVDVGKLVEDRHISVSSAARILSRRKGSRWHKMAKGTLQNKFMRAGKDRRVWELLRYMNQKGSVTEKE